MTTQSISQQRGYIIAIGGAENKKRKPVILRKFIDLCAKGNSHIAIIPTASEHPDTASLYQDLFHKFKIKRIDVLNFQQRRDCESPSALKILDTVDGVFITGGNQSRLTEIIGGTSFHENLLLRNQQGLHIAGTSAGAAFVSQTMIASGRSGNTPRKDMVQLSTGSGLIPELIVDQHFRQRHRLGRLITAIIANPWAVGIGIDEDTAVMIDANNTFEVVGSGWVTVIDPQTMQICELESKAPKQPLSFSRLTTHMLASGYRFDINTRKTTLC